MAPELQFMAPSLPVQGLSDKLVSRECFGAPPSPPDVQHLPAQTS